MTCSPVPSPAASAAFLACSASRRATSAAWPAEVRPAFISSIVEIANWTSAWSASTLLVVELGALGGRLAFSATALASSACARTAAVSSRSAWSSSRSSATPVPACSATSRTAASSVEQLGGLGLASARPGRLLGEAVDAAAERLDLLAVGAEVGAQEGERGVDAGDLSSAARAALLAASAASSRTAPSSRRAADVGGERLEALAAGGELAAQDLRVLAHLAGVLAGGGGGLVGGGGLLAGAERLLRGLLELLAGDLELAAEAGEAGAELVLVGAAVAGGLVGGAGEPGDLLEPVRVA